MGENEVKRLTKAAWKLDLADLLRLREVLDQAEAEKRHEEAEAKKARFWGDLRAVKDTINSTPCQADLAEMAVRAAKFGSCETVQILGLSAYKKKQLGDLPGAEADLRAAWELVPLCPTGNYCRLDMLRRQAKLDIQAGRGPDALSKANECLEGYRSLGGPGHDLSGDGEASALLARADILNALGDHAGAARDLVEALRLFPPKSPVWMGAHRNLAVALMGVGRKEREHAYQMLRRARHQYKRRAETVEWASFWWIDSQLTIVTGRRADRAIEKLEEVADCYHRQGMRVHYSAVIHDIARVYYPSAGDIAGLLSRLETDREFDEIKDLAGICPPTRSVLDRLDVALTSLRELLMNRSPILAPCLVQI